MAKVPSLLLLFVHPPRTHHPPRTTYHAPPCTKDRYPLPARSLVRSPVWSRLVSSPPGWVEKLSCRGSTLVRTWSSGGQAPPNETPVNGHCHGANSVDHFLGEPALCISRAACPCRAQCKSCCLLCHHHARTYSTLRAAQHLIACTARTSCANEILRFPAENRSRHVTIRQYYGCEARADQWMSEDEMSG